MFGIIFTKLFNFLIFTTFVILLVLSTSFPFKKYHNYLYFNLYFFQGVTFIDNLKNTIQGFLSIFLTGI